jgi:EAL domain-containing protein (putative c-di-GMP-specific phosphodiesterase class I)
MNAFQLDPSMLQVSSETSPQIIESSLRAIREHLGMPVAYLSQFVNGRVVYRNVDAPGYEHLIRAGASHSMDQGYCGLIISGRLPQMIPDTSENELAASLPITRTMPIGSHIAIPIHLEDGTIYGMFACLSPKPNKSLNARDLETMRLFANLATQQIHSNHRTERVLKEKRIRIESVLEENAFEIAYQPIVDLGDMQPKGFEALSRFSAEPYRTPDIWFAEAAEVGLAAELELAAIRHAVRALNVLPADQYVSVNASPQTVINPAFAPAFTGLPLSRIVLEITEHAIIEDYDLFTKCLAPLRKRGLRIAVDDAGAGHSSLRHIIQLSPDFVKVDISLTRNVDADLARRALISALLHYTRETSAQIVAEGIETEAELRTLKLLGVRRGQGYFLGRPSINAFAPQKTEARKA